MTPEAKAAGLTKEPMSKRFAFSIYLLKEGDSLSPAGIKLLESYLTEIKILEAAPTDALADELRKELLAQIARTNFEVEHGMWELSARRFYEGERGAYRVILEKLDSLAPPKPAPSEKTTG